MKEKCILVDILNLYMTFQQKSDFIFKNTTFIGSISVLEVSGWAYNSVFKKANKYYSVKIKSKRHPKYPDIPEIMVLSNPKLIKYECQTIN